MIYIDKAGCTGCGLCVDVCPTGAIRRVDGVAEIEQDLSRPAAASYRVAGAPGCRSYGRRGSGRRARRRRRGRW